MNSLKRRYLKTLDPDLFRLRYVLDPFFILARVKNISSSREFLRRFSGLFKYVGVKAGLFCYPSGGSGGGGAGIYRSLRRLWWWLYDRALDARLSLAWWRLRLQKRQVCEHPVLNPPSPLDINPPPAFELTWQIHVACNYDCTYCFYHGKRRKLLKDNHFLPAADWIRHWRRFNERYGDARINIVGGEGFVYPGFLDILSAVAARNIISLTTNLSWDPGPFIARIPPEKVEIYASFHTEFAGDQEVFISKIEVLRRAGFHVKAMMVAYPPLLPDIPLRAAAFLRRGIRVGSIPFLGAVGERVYPDSYTRKCKAALDWMIRGGLVDRFYPSGKGFSDESSAAHKNRLSLCVKYQVEHATTRGKPCNAGVSYGRVRYNGDVTRCGEEIKIGSFFDDNFGFWKEPRPCASAYCECPNEMQYMEGQSRGPVPVSALVNP